MIDEREITKALIPIIRPHINYDTYKKVQYWDNDPEWADPDFDTVLGKTTWDNEESSKGVEHTILRAFQNNDRPDNCTTLHVFSLEQLGRADRGLTYEDYGTEYQSTWLAKVDVRAYGDKARLRLHSLRSALNYTTVIGELASKGLGFMRSTSPIDQSVELDTGFEERYFMSLEFSVRDGDLGFVPTSRVINEGKLGTPVFNIDEQPISEITIESSLLTGSGKKLESSLTINSEQEQT